MPAVAERLATCGGSLVALVTPLRDQALDLATLAALCERQIRRGTGGIVVCGSTGEAPALTVAEHSRVVAAAAEAVAGRVPLLAGCGAPGTQAACELAAAAARHGADALLLSAPPYVRPTQEGLLAHVRAVAHAADLPIMLYDVPSRVAVAFSDASIATLVERELIVALKDATGDLARPPRLQALCGPGLLQFTGEDASAAAHRAMGGHGCVSVTANVAPALCAQLHRAWELNERGRVARLRDTLAPLHQALFAESNPIPVKAALALLGLCGGEVRLPLTRATPQTHTALAAVLAALMPEEDRAAPRQRYALVG
jgi:4-hydroxy-tetrahydrodipicolinate synthase